MSQPFAVIAMKCPGCGAGLQISSDMDIFACGYCGTSIRAIRQGGTISLVADAIAKVQVGTDQTAAELALIRLKDELRTTTLAIEQLESAEPKEFTPEVFPTWSLQESILTAIGLFLAIFIGRVSTFWFWGVIVLTVVTILRLRFIQRERLTEKNDFNRSTAIYARRDFDNEMATLKSRHELIKMQIAKNKLIVNAHDS